jgi:peptidoglycan hydrolase-like protein with peptidoglycan-binding domain
LHPGRSYGAATRSFPSVPCSSFSARVTTRSRWDGIFGPQTESAVEAFQESKGLAADGIVGPQTWPKLVVQVKKGSTGDAVRGVQEVIKFHDHSDGEAPPVQIDGIFGPRTDAFVRGFQTAVGTASDGIVGPITWRALVSGMLSG